jgi:hypothetical protein
MNWLRTITSLTVILNTAQVLVLNSQFRLSFFSGKTYIQTVLYGREGGIAHRFKLCAIEVGENYSHISPASRKQYQTIHFKNPLAIQRNNYD